ncbi:hypothetical protein [Pedobacter miscanthi]|uniref:hypothetical protein n=1 Tax=Pedobacter miscanthi TaxID=2259170 RepID=UPI001314DB2B|nr:hypothetical protein [Pedobacter miscanthi]
MEKAKAFELADELPQAIKTYWSAPAAWAFRRNSSVFISLQVAAKPLAGWCV